MSRKAPTPPPPGLRRPDPPPPPPPKSPDLVVGVGIPAQGAGRSISWPPNVRATFERMQKLEEFASRVLEDFWQAEDPDLQELGEEFGLLIPREVSESCGADCTCADYGFPTTCYRYSPEILHAKARIEARK